MRAGTCASWIKERTSLPVSCMDQPLNSPCCVALNRNISSLTWQTPVTLSRGIERNLGSTGTPEQDNSPVATSLLFFVKCVGLGRKRTDTHREEKRDRRLKLRSYKVCCRGGEQKGGRTAGRKRRERSFPFFCSFTRGRYIFEVLFSPVYLERIDSTETWTEEDSLTVKKKRPCREPSW